MKTYFTSDSHFDHTNILSFEERPFKTAEEMNQGLIESWNSVVNKTDTVIHFGDFSFGKYSDWIEVLNQLRGNIILIKGNHDKTKIINRVLKEGYLQEVHMVGHYMKVGKYTLNMTHYPLEIGNRPNSFSIHGHIHSHQSRMLNQVNLGVDSPLSLIKNRPFGQPVSLEELMTYLDYINPMVEAEFLKERGIE
jgi:calcineurin-like phosphoesterase family protein